MRREKTGLAKIVEKLFCRLPMLFWTTNFKEYSMKIDVIISEHDLDFNNGDQYDIDKLTLTIVRHFREMFPNSEIDITVDNCSHSSVKINGKYDGNDLLAEFCCEIRLFWNVPVGDGIFPHLGLCLSRNGPKCV